MMGGINYVGGGVWSVGRIVSSGRGLNVIMLLTVFISIRDENRKNAPLSNLVVLETSKVQKDIRGEGVGVF